MDKQEEIREGIAKKCETIWYSHDTAGSWELMATRILKYLHSQGLRLPNGEALIDETNE